MPIASELNINTSASDLDMANAIFGSGIQVIRATCSGDPAASGTYTGALSTLGNVSSGGLVSSDTGVILSTGNATDFTNSSGTTNTNTATDTGVNLANGIDGDPLLNSVAGQSTFDGAILTADFIPDGDMITMQFVFSSEEFPEYISSNVNDAFGVWVNGTFIPVTVTTSGIVAIDEINQNRNQNLYQSNTADQFNTEMDGVTRILSFKAPVNPGQVNTIRIGIADGGDAIYDSNLLIMGESIQTYALAIDDTIQLTRNSSRTFDILANDRDMTDGGLTITHLNGTAVVPGQTITLGTGETVRLNANGTVTVFSDGDVTTSTLNYTIVDSSGNTDVGLITIRTVASVARDGIVQGTSGSDVIQVGYLGDPDGDRIDNNDALGVGGTTGNGDYVIAGAGNDSVIANDGNDVVFAGTGNDTVFGGGGNDWVSLGSGDDRFGTFNADSAGNDTVYGDAGNDSIIGGGENDILYGGSGNDTLSGGVGSDSLFGNDDADRFEIIDDHQGDTIIGGEGGVDQDQIAFGNLVSSNGVNVTFTGAEMGTYAFSGTAIGTSGVFSEIEAISGTAFNDQIDATANSAAGQYLGQAGNDSITGGTAADTIYGGTGNDQLAGGAGNDSVFGDAGADILTGGTGNDTLFGGADSDVFVYTGSFGNDLVFGGDDYDTIDLSGHPNGVSVVFTAPGEGTITDLVTGDVITFSQIEQLLLSELADVVDATANNGFTYIQTLGGDDQHVGSEANDILDDQANTPNGQGNDTFSGAGGNDEIWTGTDNDFAFGGNGNDSVHGQEGNDTLYGDGGNDSVTGAEGDDILYGGEGLDSLFGGADADILFGGSGDAVFGGESVTTGTDNDTLVLNYADVESILYGGGNNEAGSVTYTAASGGGTLTFSGIESIAFTGAVDGTSGSDLMLPGFTDGQGDQIDGSDGDADTILGYGGNDTITAGLGADLVFGGEGDDEAYGGNGNDTLSGDTGNDRLQGGAGDDLLFGGGGNDLLAGDEGNDSLLGGQGDDQFIVDDHSGNDLLTGGESGEIAGDLLDASALTGDALLDLSAGDAANPEDGTLTLGGATITFSEIERFTLGSGNDQVIGSEGADWVDAGSGNDTLTGGDGADTLNGGSGQDHFFGGIGDVIDGGDGVDVLDLTFWGHPATNVIYDQNTPGSGTVEFLDAFGNVTGTLNFSNIESVVACFTPGAMILAEQGEVPIETLKPGDRVLTRDNGFQTIRWTGRRNLSLAELIAQPCFYPIFIPAGALGAGLPERDMMVSPQHRMLLSNPRAELMFGEHEVLVAARHLAGLAGITQRLTAGISYIHLLFDQHEIIRADGAWSESFQPGSGTLDGMDKAQRDEILSLFPELVGGETFSSARLTLRAREARVLLAA